MGSTNFITKNEYQYKFLPEERIIIFDNKRLINKPHHKKFTSFFENNFKLDFPQPKLITNYSPSLIKSNLANLRILLIEVTDNCNLACEYCGYGKLYNNYDPRNNKKIDFDTIKALIDYLYNLWSSLLNVSFNNTITIGFYGGEPLLAFDIIKKTILYIESLKIDFINFQYNMTTNAMLLDRYMDFLVEKKFALLLSLDGNKMNNSYRVKKNGRNSFDKVFKNIKLLQKKHPLYFEEKVNFNSVLHNKNNEKESVLFIRNEFAKVPRISPLSTHGIDETKIQEFHNMFRNRDFINLEQKDNGINSEIFDNSTEFILLSDFYDTFLSNSFNSYAELFSNESEKEYIPTGTCHPFSRKIFLTVNGKLLPCERIGQNQPLGYIEDGKVSIDFENIAELYSKKYKQIINQCIKCANWKNCSYCIFHIKEKKGKLVCDRFSPNNMIASFCSKNLTLLENKPLLFNEFTKRTFKS